MQTKWFSSKNKPTYVGCYMSENFKNFQYFATWCNKQRGFNSFNANGIRWSIDKDILVKGNKCYSEDTCVFVPQEINSFFITSKSKRGLYPIGVSKNKNNFQANCKNNTGKLIYLGTCATIESTFKLYKNYKETLAKFAAKKWYGLIDIRAIKSLKNYTVEIKD